MVLWWIGNLVLLLVVVPVVVVLLKRVGVRPTRGCCSREVDDAADAVLVVHQVEALVDLVQADAV